MAGLSHKDHILIWNDGVLAVDKGSQHYETALQTLLQIENPTAKILFDIGHIELATGRLQDAAQAFRTCTEKDPHLAIGHFQLGLCYHRQGLYDIAKKSYEKAIVCLRGNKFIDYKQLGMVYKLYECEILHNMALTLSKIDSADITIQVLEVADRGKVEAKHSTIATAITKVKQGGSFDPFTIPASKVFRPPPSKVANLKNIDYLGKAKVVSELTVPDNPKFLHMYASFNARQEKVCIRKKWTRPRRGPRATAGRSRSPSPLPPSKPPPLAPPTNAFRPISPYNPESPTSPSSPGGGGGGIVKLKDSILIWNEGVIEYDNKNYTGALDRFLNIEEPSAKILFNMASLQVRLGQTNAATNTLQSALAKDQHLAIAHCLLGNLYCKVNRTDDAWRQYEKCLECFRSNKSIDYKQLGMSYKLCQCEVLYNQAYTYAKLGEVDWCTKLLEDAQRCKLEEKHNFIDTAIDNYKRGVLFNILDLPVSLVFRPPKDKVANLKKQDYLGKQKVVSQLKPSTPPPAKPSTPPPIERKPPAAPPPSAPVPQLPVPSAPVPQLPVPSAPVPQLPVPSAPVPQRAVPQINRSFEDGELYLPIAPAPLAKENTYHQPPRPPKPKSSSMPSQAKPPSAPARSTSLNSQHSSTGDRSPSPGLPGRAPPQIPAINHDDDFDSDSFDEDGFEDDYISKPVPVPLSRRFSASNPLPPAPLDSPEAPRRPPPARPPPSPIPNSSPSRASPVPLRPVPSPTRGSPVPLRPVPSPTRSSPVPFRPVPSPTRGSPVPQERPVPQAPVQNSQSRSRKISLGLPPSKPVPPSPRGSPRSSPRSSPVPRERPPPPEPKESPANSPARQRKISSGPPPKPVPPNPHRTSPKLPERLPPAPSPSVPSLPPAPKGRETPVPKPVPPSRGLPLRPARPVAYGSKKSLKKPISFKRRLSSTHVVSVAPFKGEDDDMLTFHTGELIKVHDEVDEHWLEGEVRGCHGIFPREFIEEMSLAEMAE